MSEYAPSLWDKLRTTPLSDVLRGDLSGSLDWHGAVERAELPPQLAELVLEVVRCTRLWKRERVAVAQELAAHFRDGLEAGASIETLAESFGDPVAAAKLVRRAKRRCRPLWWHAWWYASRTFAGLLALYLGAAGYLSLAKPVVSVNYLEVINREAAAASDEDRAWPLYFEALMIVAEEQRAIREAEPHSGKGLFVDWAPEWMGEDQWTPKQGAKAAKWVDAHRTFLDKLVAAAGRPGFGFELGAWSPAARQYDELEPVFAKEPQDPREQWLASVLLPQVQQLQSVVRALKADAMVAFDRGDAAGNARAILAMLGAADHAAEPPFLVCLLMRHSLVRPAIDEVHRVLAKKPALWSESQLRDVALALARPGRPFAYYLEGERAHALDSIQRVYSPSGLLTARGLHELDAFYRPYDSDKTKTDESFTKRVASVASLPATAISSATAGESRAAVNRFMDLAAIDAQSPLAATSTAEEFAASLSSRYELFKRLAPAMAASHREFVLSAGERDGVLLGIALELYRRKAGDWPTTLDQLVPRYMPELPIDRISGGPLGYGVLGGKPVVYSLGRDADDDLGKPCANASPLAFRVLHEPRRYDYYVDRPYTAEQLATLPSSQTDGDWVIWSLGEPRYVEVEE
jgi:hypothetical protein